MLDTLVGNERTKQILRRMFESQRVPGALLFTGEEGVGKRLFALEVARALNCRTPIQFEGCGKCSICVRIGQFSFPAEDNDEARKEIIWSNYPDVGFVLRPKRVLLVDQMRRVANEANFRPFEGKRRVFIIEEADRLNDSSSNALLKTLEEPPKTSHLILFTSRPAILLPTIRSRCQTIRFAPLTPQEIGAYLTKNKIEGTSDVGLRSRTARGSISRALQTDPEEYKEQREIMLSILNALTVAPDRTQLLRSAEVLNDARHKDQFEERLDLLEALIRDVWLLILGVSTEQIVNIDLLPQLTEIVQRTDSARAASWIAQIEELREQLAVNINRKIATDALFVSMAAA